MPNIHCWNILITKDKENQDPKKSSVFAKAGKCTMDL